MRQRTKDKIEALETTSMEVEVYEDVLDKKNENVGFFARVFDPERYYDVIDGEVVRRSTDYFGRELYYPVSYLDVDDYAKTTVLFGALGLHKFKEHSILRGIGYILTCGFFGAGYLCDVLLVFLNSVKLHDGTYLGPNYNRKKLLKYLPAGIAITVTLMVTYFFIMRGLGAGLGLIGEAVKNIER